MTATQTAPAQTNQPIRLSQSTLAQLPANIQVPNYDRSAVKAGIMHMSVGGFHRSHQAVYLDDALALGGNDDWGLCGIGMLPQDKDNIEALRAQDGLYSVLERNANEDKLRVVGSMVEVMHAPSDPQAVLKRLIDPSIRILSLTVTEKGYFYNTAGDLDQTHPAIQGDLANPEKPATFYGYLAAALAARKANGDKPFTVMSCDNLPGNGHLTQKLVLQFAALKDAGLAAWIKENVSFPNAMVDRITPVTTPAIVSLVEEQFNVADQWPVVCEDFRQWVLEDDFCNGRPSFDKAGAQMVANVEPYEKMKVRLLNGSHSALSYISYLMGYREVDKAMADPLISGFVRAYMDNDITPSVPDVPGIDLDAYKAKLIERFSNPAIADQVQRLAEDGSQKIPNAILPCIAYQLNHGGSIKFASLALAGWFRYLTGVDENLEPIAIKDPRAEKLTAAVKVSPLDPVPVLGLSDVFGHELPQSQELVDALRAALKDLDAKGARQTVADYL